MDSPDRPQESQTEPCGMVWGVPGLNWGLFHVCEEQLQQPKHGGDLENEAKQATFMSPAITDDYMCFSVSPNCIS